MMSPAFVQASRTVAVCSRAWMSVRNDSIRSATNFTGRRSITDSAAVAISSGYTCTLIPNDPPTSLQITRTFDSGMPR
jgi:hypothetical protein